MSLAHFSRTFVFTAVAFLAANLASAQTLVSSGDGGGLTSPLALDDVEITPNEAYAVMRENNSGKSFRVYDLATGALVASGAGVSDPLLMGECLDAVAVTNTRAVVLGTRAQVLDLTNLASPILADVDVGFRPRDVAITPDGTIAAVRGGRVSAGGTPDGLFLLDLATGATLASAPGTTKAYLGGGAGSWNVDAVAVSNRHAVFLSTPPGSSTRTRITVFTLHPTGGGPPVKSFETSAARDMSGAPHDVSMSPDGLHAAVRSEISVAVLDLTADDTPVFAFQKRLFGGPGPFEDSAMDSVEVTNERVVTLSKITNPALSGDAQIDFFDMAGTQRFHRVQGLPHDLALTPDGTRVVVRTSETVALYSLADLGAGPELAPLDEQSAPSAGTYYFGGLDSVVATNRTAVTLAQSPSQVDTLVQFWHIADGDLKLLATRGIDESRPIDLALTADHAKVAVAGNASVSIFHVETGVQTFDHHQVDGHGFYQWCDGVVASANKVAAVGQFEAQAGWFVLADVTPFFTSYCTSVPNSAGTAATIRALGTASVADNDLKLFCEGAPSFARGRFVYGTAQEQTPFGDGFQCVGGTSFTFPRVVSMNAAGAGHLPVDYLAQQVPAGVITPGSTWHFQFKYIDPLSTGTQVNSSDALSITFTP